MAMTLVQYIIVRGDLLKDLKWPVGAVMAQACHAVTAVAHLYAQDEETKLYLEDLDNMHKVILEAPDAPSLIDLSEKFKENSINHKLWIEQPEDIPTCIAVKPYQKEHVHRFVKKFKLFK